MQNLTRYKVPLKYQPFIDIVMKDPDGIWVYLKDGVISDVLECGTIHEDTWKVVLHVLRTSLVTDDGKPVFGKGKRT